MKRFLVLYLTPPSVLDSWAKTDADKRMTAEAKMRTDWTAWTAAHAGMIKSTEVGGKTTRVTTGGTADHRNEIMLYSFVEGSSREAVAKAFENHPHLGIPQASIEIMDVRPMQDM